MRALWATLGVVLTLGVAGCSSEPAKASGTVTEIPGNSESHRMAYIATVRGKHDVSKSDTELVQIAQAMCKALNDNPPGAVFASLQQGLGDAAPTVMGAGMSAYCPEHLDKIG